VVERSRELVALGLDRLILLGAGRAPGLETEGRAAHRALVAEVLPALS
jgi:hypothetical protein